MPIIGASLYNLDWVAGATLVFGIFVPSVNKPKELKKIVTISIVLGFAVIFVFTILNIGVFGASFLQATTTPLLQLAGYGKITSVFQRIEPLIIVLWIAWMFLRTATLSYSTLICLSHLLRLRDARFLIIPEIILAAAFSLVVTESTVEINYTFQSNGYLFLIIDSVIPFVLWTVARIRFRLLTSKSTE
jgi:spore germination protein KB